ncbi:hypothetical protein CBS101457_000158 [Exobasidium rhododendri]|nr:hypothetical protein CBS101457_000158 [Exobasidium rhododendri]
MSRSYNMLLLALAVVLCKLKVARASPVPKPAPAPMYNGNSGHYAHPDNGLPPLPDALLPHDVILPSYEHTSYLGPATNYPTLMDTYTNPNFYGESYQHSGGTHAGSSSYGDRRDDIYSDPQHSINIPHRDLMNDDATFLSSQSWGSEQHFPSFHYGNVYQHQPDLSVLPSDGHPELLHGGSHPINGRSDNSVSERHSPSFQYEHESISHNQHVEQLTEEENQKVLLWQTPPFAPIIDMTQPEYTLQVDTSFPFANDEELVYKNLTDDQKAVIVDHIHQVRPYTEDYLRQQLMLRLTPQTAQQLLSKDPNEVDNAVEELYPTDDVKSRTLIRWMTGFSKEEKIEIIEKLARVTQQSSDKLRDLFISRRVTPIMANELLHASTEEEVWDFAQKYDLVLVDGQTTRPWQKGSREIQRRALRQRMTAFGLRHKQEFYTILKKSKVPPGYALTMLRATDVEFAVIMRWLRLRSNSRIHWT